MILYLTRHGQTQWNAQSKMQGQCDSPLTPEGYRQAGRLADRLRGEPIERIYTSPLSRARDTAGILARGRDLPVLADDRLRECALGVFEGHSFAEMEKLYPEAMYNFRHHPERFEPVGEGENFHQVRERAAQFLADVAASDCNCVLAVAHALVLRVIRTVMLDIGLERMLEGRMSSCCYCRARWEGGKWHIDAFGESLDNLGK